MRRVLLVAFPLPLPPVCLLWFCSVPSLCLFDHLGRDLVHDLNPHQLMFNCLALGRTLRNKCKRYCCFNSRLQDSRPTGASSKLEVKASSNTNFLASSFVTCGSESAFFVSSDVSIVFISLFLLLPSCHHCHASHCQFLRAGSFSLGLRVLLSAGRTTASVPLWRRHNWWFVGEKRTAPAS